MSELKKITKSVPSGGMKRPASSGGNSGQIIRTPPKTEMERPVPPRTIVAECTLDSFGKWTLDDVGLLIIDGKGKMPDWEWDGDHEVATTPWCQRGKAEAIKRVHISDGVTSVGNAAFGDCKSLTSIYIPDGVPSIGNWAFGGCESLTNIHIPDSVKSIGERAFDGCESLTRIHIPDSVTYLDSGVFL